jgi:hypothetical protein
MEKNPRRSLKPFGMIQRDKDFFDKSQEMLNSFRKVEPNLQENNALSQEAEEE